MIKKAHLSLEDLFCEELPSEIVELAASKLLESDRESFTSWYRRNKHGLPEVIQHSIATSASIFYCGEGLYNLAYFWIAKMNEGDQKRKRRAEIWQEEKAIIHGLARSDPKAGIELILGGEIHADYWIGIVFDLWLGANAKDAREWYESAGKSLTPRQREFIVMSFVNASMEAKRPEVAKKWSERLSSQDLLAQAREKYPMLFKSKKSTENESAQRAFKIHPTAQQMSSTKHFVIFFTASQGSSAIQSLLGMCPEIGIVGFEPFDPYRFKGASPEVEEEFHSVGLLDLFRATYSDDQAHFERLPELYARYSTEKIWAAWKPSRGFKFRFMEWFQNGKIGEPETRSLANDPILKFLCDNGIHIFHLKRNNILLQAISLYKGVDMQFKLRDNTLQKQELEKITVDLHVLEKHIAQIHQADQMERETADVITSSKSGSSSWIFYEDFLYHPGKFLAETLPYLGLSYSEDQIQDLLNRPNAFKKVHSTDLTEIVSNSDAIFEAFPAEAELYFELQHKYR